MRQGGMWTQFKSSRAFVTATVARQLEQEKAARIRDKAATEEIERKLLQTVVEDGWRPKGWSGD
jgi:hypothetical protein